MKTFKINISDHFRHLWLYILMVICFPALFYFLMIYKKGYFDLNIALKIGGLYFLIYSIPLILLHLNYYLNNRKDEFEYETSTGNMLHKKRNNKTKFTSKDIHKVVVYKSWPLSRNGLPIFAWDLYNYAVIELKDGQIIKLSSLLVNELDKVLKFNNIEVKKTLYAWMS
jgi:hypothetical protein